MNDPLNDSQAHTCTGKFICRMKPLKYAKKFMHILHIKAYTIIRN